MENPLPHFNEVKMAFDLELNDGIANLKRMPLNREAIHNSMCKLDDLLIDLDGLFIMCEKRGLISQHDKCLFEFNDRWWESVRAEMVAALSTNPIISSVDIPVQCSPSSGPSSPESQNPCQNSDVNVMPVESYAMSTAPCSSPAPYALNVLVIVNIHVILSLKYNVIIRIYLIPGCLATEVNMPAPKTHASYAIKFTVYGIVLCSEC